MLLDVLIAMVFGTVVMIAVLAISMTAHTAGYAARENNIAYSAARQVMENIRAVYGASITAAATPPATPQYTTDNTSPSTNPPNILGPVPQLLDLPKGAAASATVVQRTNTYSKYVIVTVTWQPSGGGPNRSKTLSTLMTPGGVTP